MVKKGDPLKKVGITMLLRELWSRQKIVRVMRSVKVTFLCDGSEKYWNLKYIYIYIYPMILHSKVSAFEATWSSLKIGIHRFRNFLDFMICQSWQAPKHVYVWTICKENVQVKQEMIEVNALPWRSFSNKMILNQLCMSQSGKTWVQSCYIF